MTINSTTAEDRLKVPVETVLPLSEAWKAHERSESHHARGKIVLRVKENER